MFVAMRLLRRGSVRFALFALGLFSVVLYFYYSKYYLPGSEGDGGGGGNVGPAAPVRGSAETLSEQRRGDSANRHSSIGGEASSDEWPWPDVNVSVDASWSTAGDGRDSCPLLLPAKADIDTVKMYSTLNFNPRFKEFWNENFERRYLKRRESWSKLPLEVIIVPHSHNDPGWLKTFEGYYHSQTANILNNMVDKLFRYPNMTFVWSEISYLAKWWKSAHHQKREALKELLVSGRLELLVGGWVMSDEATVQLYSLLDQMIEGHQWVRHHLDYTPRNSWSIDPFGHGNTMPYLLRAAGISGMTVQRIHHGWKERLAELQSGDFLWRQSWDVNGQHDILCHNFPFDIYNIKHSCGPHTQVCLTFDFRKVRGEFTEYTQRAQPVTQWNLRERAETLLAQYGRTASLFPHNVALVLLGDDFRFDHAVEWDQQYSNYQQLIERINSQPDLHAHVQFGTLSTYFQEVERRMRSPAVPVAAPNGGPGVMQWLAAIGNRDGGKGSGRDGYPVLTGDFFVYSDVFNEGRPSYWSGYFTTRPFYKALGRELESTLRSAEIVYALALARSRQQPGVNRTVQILERDYQRITGARQRLADFQHHDATTGTSKVFVMHDFGVKLYDGIQLATSVLTHALQYLLTARPRLAEHRYESLSRHFPNFLYPLHDRPNFATLPRPIPLPVRPPSRAAGTVGPSTDSRLVVVNTLAHFRHELIKVTVRTRHVRLLDPDGRPLAVQFNPVWNVSAGPFHPMRDELELSAVLSLPPLSVGVYTVQGVAEPEEKAEEGETDERRSGQRRDPRDAVTAVHNAGEKIEDFPSDLPVPVIRESRPPATLQLENDLVRATFNPATGLLDSVHDKRRDRTTRASLTFQAYVSAQFHSGAYLFMPEPRQPVINVSDNAPYYSVTRGPLYSEVTIVYPNFLRHITRLFHRTSHERGVEGGRSGNDPLFVGLFMENLVDYPPPPHFRETELFLRVATDVRSGDSFHTDQNCFQMQHRLRLPRVGPEINYYPITCMMFAQDAERRASLLVSRAHGGSSLSPGWLEVMLDRRSMYDDSRGLGEGVADNRPTVSRFWLLLEPRVSSDEDPAVARPSLAARHLSNALSYPAQVFAVDSRSDAPRLHRRVLLLDRPLPCDVHLLNIRVLPVSAYFELPSRSALLLLHRQSHSCDYEAVDARCPLSAPDGRLSDENRLRHVNVSSLSPTLLTAMPARPAEFASEATPSSSSLPLGVAMSRIAVRPMEIASWNVTFA